MKKIFAIAVLCAMVLTLGACKNNKKKAADAPADDAEAIFDGKTFEGWRGYLTDHVPGAWTIEDGCIKINGSGRGEAGAVDGGDIIFAAKKFKNFEFTFEWKVSEGANSGVFFLAQEVPGISIYQTCPEYQILDNERHPDAKLGRDGNRQSASLYDIIPAKPQNAKPAGEWNTAKIMVYEGTVVHYQNGEPVVEYHLWTPKWEELINNSKFSEANMPESYQYILNVGGENHEGYIGLQDHGDTVWYRNLKVKEL